MKSIKSLPKGINIKNIEVNVRNYYRINIPLSLDEIIPNIKVGPIEIFGMKINTNGKRLRTFKRSTICISCGLKGSVFYVERLKGQNSWHLNLYGILPDGTLKLMTKDHWIPRSRGGSNRIRNLKTMCCKCNQKKSNMMPGEYKNKLNKKK